MIRGRFLRSGDDTSAVFALREQVFVDELGCSEAFARDALDDMAIYALVFDELDVPSGAGRLAIDDDRFMVGAVCVRGESRGQGLGDLIMRMLLLRVQEMDAPSVYAKAQPDVQPFFQRYGFKLIEPTVDGRSLMRALKDEIDIEGACHKGADGCAGCDKECGRS